jgi:Tfp pilus assembly protein PilX
MSKEYGAGLGRMTTVVRVTARGVGGAEDTVVYLQSNYMKLN